MLKINLVFDANAAAAPPSFRDGVQAAAAILDAAIFDPITVNIAVGYGEIDLNGPNYMKLTGGASYGGERTPIQVSYSALRAVLAATESSANDAVSVNALPNAASLNGQSAFSISSAQAKAFGAIPATDTAIDGIVGFPTSFTGNALVDAAITEEVHALGLLNAGGDLGLFSYTSPGIHLLSTGVTAAMPAYFSIDGGTTVLANYNVSNDETLFLNLPNDPLNDPDLSSTVLTSLDLTEISAIGFNATSTPVVASPTIVPTTTLSGVATITPQNASVSQNGSITAASFLKSVAVPAGHAIAYYGFYDAGGGTGHLSINGVAQPDNNYIFVLSTQLNTVLYVGGTAPGSEIIDVVGFDFDAGMFTAASQLTATTTSAISTASGSSSTTGSASTSVYSIVANDAGSATRVDGTSGTTPYTFTVSRTGDTSQATTLGYTVTGSGPNPAPSTLFQNPTGSVTLAAGSSSAVLTITAIGMAVTSSEGFTVTISGGNGSIAVPAASDTVGANTVLLDPGTIALNAASVYAFANTGAPSFTAVVNQDGSTDLGRGGTALSPGFIGGYVAGIEIRIMANLEQTGASTAQIDGQFARDMGSISSLLTPGTAAVGFGFLSGLTTGGPTGLTGVGVPAGLQADIQAALGTDQQATGAVFGCVAGAVTFVQGYINAIGARASPIAALQRVEATAFAP